MPACNIQCNNDNDADCGSCKHRDKDYPWPGGADGRLSARGLMTGNVLMSYHAVSEDEQYNIAALSVKYPGGIWSHWC